MSVEKEDMKTSVDRPLSDMHEDGVHFDKDILARKKAKKKPENQPDPEEKHSE
jgi:hypothetical protein